MAVMTQKRLFEDLRDFVDRLREAGELREVRARVERVLEVGAICRENFDRDGPALLFRQVDDYQTPLVVGVLSAIRHYAMALDVEPEMAAISAKWKNAYQRPIPPREVPRHAAPCKEVVLPAIDLNADPFPVPLWRPLDGGPYLATLCAVISVDPESGWYNLGAYRGQILERDKLGCSFPMRRHIAMHWRKFQAMGKPLPVAIAIGLDPYLVLTACTEVPSEVSEYDVGGGLKGAPVEVVRAETSDLLVPAHAEIVIEGDMSTDPSDTFPVEGPVGEFTGFMGEAVPNARYIKVKAITHRRNPYFQATLEGRPPSESTVVRGIGRSMALLEHLRRAGIPGIVDAWVTPGGCAGFHAVVAIRKLYPGQVQDVISTVWGHPNMFIKLCTVVDEGIDIRNPMQVEWAIATRVQAGRDVKIVQHGKSAPLDTSQVPSQRGWSDLMGIDATIPHEYYEAEGGEFPASADPSPESIARVKARWPEYGID